MPLAPGTHVGNYEILAPLGQGGMGEVYRARDRRLERDIALKLLPTEVAAQPDRMARFEREAKMVAGLNHPNIVVLHSIEEAEGRRFLTMELVDGESLDRLVVPGGLPLGRVVELALPIADALCAAHARGIVHRDLKPANVVVTRDRRVKVLDFGLAKLSTGDAGGGSFDAMRTMTAGAPISTVGQVVGTVPYMAPEQLRGDSVDERSDLFSLGILIYELATGRRPFAGATAADVSSSILRDEPPPLTTLRADLPAELVRLVERCLEKSPDRRVQTARDVRAELERTARSLESGAGTSHQAPAAAPKDAPSIAVLPFVNLSRDEENEYFSDGLAEELLNVLAKIRGLRVAARSSAFSFKGKDATVGDIGRALKVATVLEGSVRKSGNRVRIGVQLVKVEDGYHLWSDRYDRTLDDIFAVQDDIAQAVVKELRTTLLGEAADSDAVGDAKADVAQAAKGRGESGEAYRLYLQGRALVDRFVHDDCTQGIAYLRQAIALEPAHALAWATLGRALATASAYSWLPLAAGYAEAREASLRALEIEPGLAEGYVSLSAVQLGFDRDWAGALSSVRRALDLAPGSVEVLRQASNVFRDHGSQEEAVVLAERAVEQDPLNPGACVTLGSAYRSVGRLEDAERAFRRALDLSPGRTLGHLRLTMVLLESGRIEEAAHEANAEPQEWARLTAQALVEWSGGRRENSERALQELIEKYGHSSNYQVAWVYASRGDEDRMFDWLARAREARDPGLALVRREPLFRPFHAHPRWREFLATLGTEPDPT